jgi:hypothetical protein
VHADAKKKGGAKKSFLVLAVLQILLGVAAIISQVGCLVTWSQSYDFRIYQHFTNEGTYNASVVAERFFKEKENICFQNTLG